MADDNDPYGLNADPTGKGASPIEDEDGHLLQGKDVQQYVTYRGKKVLAGKVVNPGGGVKIWHRFSDKELAANAAAEDKKAADDKKQEAADLKANSAKSYTTADGATIKATPASTGYQADSAASASGADTTTVVDPFAYLSGTYADAKIATQYDTSGGEAHKPILVGNGQKNGQTTSISDLVQQFASQNSEQIRAQQQKMKDAGFAVDVTGVADPDTLKSFANAAQGVFIAQKAGHSITIDNYLDSLIKANPANQPKTAHEKSSSVSLTDPVKARETLADAMADKLGRRPTDQEIVAFTKSLNQYEQANPTVTDSTRTTDANGLETSADSTTTGKATDAGTFAQQYIQNQHGPEAEAVNHLQWYQVMMNALTNSPVQTGNPT